MLWIGRGESRAAGLPDSMELHELRPRPIRIEQIELPLRIASNLRQVFLSRQSIAVPQQCVRRLDALHAEREVIQHAQV